MLERRRGDNDQVLKRSVAVALMAMLVTGCGVFTAPAQPTSGDLTDIVSVLVRRNMTITNQVAGDPGCRDTASSLHSNAVRYDVRPFGDTNSYPVFVFGWKSQATFDADNAAFDACAQAYQQATAGTVTTVEHLPWRAFGPGWPTGLSDAVDAALKAAGGVPAPQEPE